MRQLFNIVPYGKWLLRGGLNHEIVYPLKGMQNRNALLQLGTIVMRAFRYKMVTIYD